MTHKIDVNDFQLVVEQTVLPSKTEGVDAVVGAPRVWPKMVIVAPPATGRFGEVAPVKSWAAHDGFIELRLV